MDYNPADFSLDIDGSLFKRQTKERGTRLCGRVTVQVALIVPPVLALVPHDTVRAVGRAVSRSEVMFSVVFSLKSLSFHKMAMADGKAGSASEPSVVQRVS